MAKRDEKGYIHYSPEELARIPSFEERSARGGLTFGGLGLPELTALTGGIAGAGLGPGAALGGLVAGKVVGDQIAGASGSGARQGAENGAGQTTATATGEPPQMPTEAGAQATLEALDRDLREEEADRMRRTRP